MKQKEEERLVIGLFREKLSGFPKGKLVQSESPDFVLKVNPKFSIGIELTRLPGSTKNLYEDIVSSIQKKNQKRAGYSHMQIQEHWLIIYTDDLEIYHAGHLKNNLSKWSFQIEFDKVYLFELFDGHVFSLTRGYY